MSGGALVERSARDLRRMIGARELSAVELLEACLRRIEEVDPGINAVTVIDDDAARHAAERADAAVMRGEPLGLLHGLPVAVKDTQDVAGMRSTSGAPVHADRVPEADEAQVARVRSAGAVVLCKTNVPQWAAGANTRNPVWGATGNPFDQRRTVGGSSGGSAAAVATDMVPLATGSDTGGSLRIPAAFCGVVGYRPSPGVVPAAGRSIGWTPISVLGPIARDVADAALLLSAQAAFNADDPLSTPLRPQDLARATPADVATLRIGVSVDLGFAAVDPDHRRMFARKVDRIAGIVGSVSEVTPALADAHRVFDVARALSFVGGMEERYRVDPTSLGPFTLANVELGLTMSLLDVARAQAEQTRMFRDFQRHFDEFDAIITPAVPCAPFPWSLPTLTDLDGVEQDQYYRWLALTYGVSLVGNPAVAIPAGRDDEGLPFGIQIVGRHRGDVELLSIALGLEQAFAGDEELIRPRPDLSTLRVPFPELRSDAARGTS